MRITLDNLPAANASRNLTCKAAETAATSFSGTAKHTECSLLACMIFAVMKNQDESYVHSKINGHYLPEIS